MCLHVLQDSLDELQMDDYWKEVENITRTRGGAGRVDGGGEGEVQEEEQQKIPEGRDTVCMTRREREINCPLVLPA